MKAYSASAPGKLVILGEYAVLDGAPALAMAVNRRCRAELASVREGPCRLQTRMPAPEAHRFEPGRASGVALVDLVTAGGEAPTPWHGVLDTSALFASGIKLGLGSSAAALCAWAGVWAAFTSRDCGPLRRPDLGGLIRLHRRFQSGGSGVDVAASFTGGVVSYRLEPGNGAAVGSVRLPNSVGFASIFAGRSASTPGLVARYRAFGRERPRQAAELRQRLGGVAEVGCEAARDDDAREFIEAVAEYGRGLEALGRAVGVEIMTPEHRAIAAEARRLGLAYKVSGAGGGDLGLAFSDRPEVLAELAAAVGEKGFEVVELGVDPEGLVVEERA